MSSIYDALQRLQEDGKASVYAPMHAEAGKRGRFWMIVIGAVVLSSASTALIYSHWMEDKPPQVPRQAPPSVTNAPAAQARRLDPAWLFAQAEEQRMAGDNQKAIELYVKALHLAPDRNKDAYVRLGTLYFEQQDYEKASLTYHAALKYFKNDAVLLNNMGGVLLAKGDTDGAIGYFRLASNCSKDYVEPVYNLACAYARKGDKTMALSALKKALSMHPDVKLWAEKDPDLEVLKDAWSMKDTSKGEK